MRIPSSSHPLSAQSSVPEKNEPDRKVSTYADNPFSGKATEELIPADAFTPGTTALEGPDVKIVEPTHLRDDYAMRTVENPFSLPTADADGNFLFPDEPRFPRQKVKPDPTQPPTWNGEPAMLWVKRDLHIAQTTAFDAATDVKRAADGWAGRDLQWGTNGQLVIEAHGLVGLNGMYGVPDGADSPRVLLGVAEYENTKRNGEKRIFEMAASWEVVAHEAGHALHGATRPRTRSYSDDVGAWAESFGDQVAMWTALQEPERIDQLILETGGKEIDGQATDGKLNRSNSVTKTGEGFENLRGVPGRDAVNTVKASEAGTEVHDRSHPITGAAYDLFRHVVKSFQREGLSQADAIAAAADVMGTLLLRSADYLPGNVFTFEDIAKAYLSADADVYGGKYARLIEKTFTARELMNGTTRTEWQEHRASLPDLHLAKPTREAAEALVKAELDKLGIEAPYGVIVTGFEVLADGYVTVLLEMTTAPGSAEVLMMKRIQRTISVNGAMVFRPDGTLAEYHPPTLDETDRGLLSGALGPGHGQAGGGGPGTDIIWD